MPRTAIDYSKSVIYKIQHLEKDELVYVGSTTSFVKRKYAHKSACKTKPNKVYEMIRDNGGWDCFNMIIIKDYPCHSSKELNQEEDKVMRELNSSLNMMRPYITTEERTHQKHQNYENRKEEINIRHKKYYENNKEELSKKAKEKYKKNKEQINKRRRELRIEKKNNAINLKK